jgi:hypothetical protein
MPLFDGQDEVNPSTEELEVRVLEHPGERRPQQLFSESMRPSLLEDRLDRK